MKYFASLKSFSGNQNYVTNLTSVLEALGEKYFNSVSSTLLMLKKAYFSIIFAVCITCTQAQSKSNQLWTDFTANKSLSNNFSADCEISYRTVLSNSNNWNSFSLIPKIEKSLTKHWDLLLYVGSINTLQQSGDHTWEVRPAIGIRFRFTPLPRLQIRFLGRLELRNQYNLESGLWTNDFRTRIRVEETYFINGNSYASNHLFYLLSDLELFLTVDKELQERFSNRMLLRLGLGYKQSGAWRFETIYTYQYAKNTIDGEFANLNDGILRLRIRYYF